MEGWKTHEWLPIVTHAVSSVPPVSFLPAGKWLAAVRLASSLRREKEEERTLGESQGWAQFLCCLQRRASFKVTVCSLSTEEEALGSPIG